MSSSFLLPLFCSVQKRPPIVFHPPPSLLSYVKQTQTPNIIINESFIRSLLVITVGQGFLWEMVMAAAESEFHVLAVDDSLLDRKLIERLLKTSSFQVTTVDSGSKALEFLGFNEDENRRSPDSPSVSSNNNQVVEVNLVITDYCMPGMTGYDLLKKIKESSTLKNIPVVIMSSENVPSRISRCLEEGAEEFFLKPVKQSDLKRLKPHLMKTKLKDQKHDKTTEDEEEEEEEEKQPRDLETAELESRTQQQQQQRHQQQQPQQLPSNNNAKRKSMGETLSPDRTRPRYADIAAPV